MAHQVRWAIAPASRCAREPTAMAMPGAVPAIGGTTLEPPACWEQPPPSPASPPTARLKRCCRAGARTAGAGAGWSEEAAPTCKTILRTSRGCRACSATLKHPVCCRRPASTAVRVTVAGWTSRTSMAEQGLGRRTGRIQLGEAGFQLLHIRDARSTIRIHEQQQLAAAHQHACLHSIPLRRTTHLPQAAAAPISPLAPHQGHRPSHPYA